MTTRREWLSSLGFVATGGFAADRYEASLNAAMGVDDSNNPAAGVADRTTTIRITKLTATPVQRKVFLKLETNHGVTGWGEIDEAKLDELARMPGKPEWPTRGRLPDGAISDY